jgi:hypothetical protein
MPITLTDVGSEPGTLTNCHAGMSLHTWRSKITGPAADPTDTSPGLPGVVKGGRSNGHRGNGADRVDRGIRRRTVAVQAVVVVVPHLRLGAQLRRLRPGRPQPRPREALMGVPPIDKELPWDEMTRTVAQAVVQHLPEATKTEVYYHLVTQHLAGVLWRLGRGHLALRALGTVLRTSVRELRPLVADAITRPER